mgnify:CR=1 FL=1
MYCQICGSEIEENFKACPACGSKFASKDNSKTDKHMSTRTIMLAYFAAVIFPVIGLVLSIYFLFRHRIGQAIGVATTSFFFVAFWYGVFMSGPTAAIFEWDCGPSGIASYQCEIRNTGTGAGTLEFDMVLFCGSSQHVVSINSGEVSGGSIVQRVARFSDLSSIAQCDGIEYRNELIR